MQYPTSKRIPMPIPGVPPINGKYYTWEDDANNLRMRAEEDRRPYTPTGRSAPHDHPGRCRGYAIRRGRPCREWAVKNLAGRYTKFCKLHTQHGIIRTRNSRKMMHSPGGVVTGVDARMRHGAYSQIVRERMIAILDGSSGNAEDRSNVLNLVQAMDAVNTDNPAESLDFAIKAQMGVMALMMQRFATGRLKFEDFTMGMSLCGENMRKLVATRHDVVGTADDENERAILDVLNREGLGPNAFAPPSSFTDDGVDYARGEDVALQLYGGNSEPIGIRPREEGDEHGDE